MYNFNIKFYTILIVPIMSTANRITCSYLLEMHVLPTRTTDTPLAVNIRTYSVYIGKPVATANELCNIPGS